MSAIAGILYFDGAPVVSGLIEALTGAMRSRGPDEQTHWSHGSVALGHCMLRTTSESLEEHQPVMSQDGKIVLVWDGRLDNRNELHKNLISGGFFLRNNSDAEIVLQCYAMWGEDCPNQLLGDFAFAIWNVKTNRIFCARDHMGARPFYYVLNENFFAFASEDEALINLPGVSRKFCEERVAYFLVPEYQGFDYANSWLKDVRSLFSAQSISVSSNGIEQKNIYWRFNPGEQEEFSSDEECEKAFLEVFGEAVRCRMRSFGDIAAMMSGGLDSASIGAMAKRLLSEMPGKQFHTYSAISDHPETCLESQCIQSLTKDLGHNGHFVSVPSFTGVLSVQDLIEAAWSKPHPIDSSILLPALMCLAASRDGHRVMLHGVCGDLSTYVPHFYIASILKEGEWRRAWHECCGASRNNTYLRGKSPLFLLLRNLWLCYGPPRAKRFVRGLRDRKVESFVTRSLINLEFAKKLNLVEWMRSRAKHVEPTLTEMQKMHIQVLQPPHGIASGLGGYDRVAGRYGVELRDPWGDRRVVEFWLRLPMKYKVRNGWSKYLVRSTFAADLGSEVAWRLGKEHLGWNFAFRLMDESTSLVARTLGHGLSVIDKYVNVDAVREKYSKYIAKKNIVDKQTLYDIVTLALWMK